MVVLDENDIILVMEQANVSRNISIRALTIFDGDIINSILYLCERRGSRNLRRVLKDITNIR